MERLWHDGPRGKGHNWGIGSRFVISMNRCLHEALGSRQDEILLFRFTFVVESSHDQSGLSEIRVNEGKQSVLRENRQKDSF